MMESLPPRSLSMAHHSNQPRCDHQDPVTGKTCGKTYSKRSNLRRHIEQKHSAGVQNADFDTDVDDSQSLPGHDSVDDGLMEEFLLEPRRTHCASAPPLMTAPLAPMTAPQALPASESAQTIPPINTSINTSPILAASSGLNVADGWLIPGSLAPRGHSAGWSLYSPSNSITSAPRIPSPLPDSMPEQHISQSIDQLAGDLTSEDYAQGISTLPSILWQTTDQQPGDFQQTPGPVPPDGGHTMNPAPDQPSQNIYQLDLTPEELTQAMISVSQPFAPPTNQPTGDFSQISSSLPQDISQQVSSPSGNTGQNIDQFNDDWTTEDFAQTMDSMVQTSRPATNEPARDFSRTSTPVPQDLNQSLNAISRNFGQIINHLASMSRPSSPVPQDIGYMRDPRTYERSRTCSPLPHNCSRMASPTPQTFSTNQVADCSSKANASFSSFTAAAQLTLDSPDVVQHPGVVSDSEVDSDPIVATTGRKRKLSHSNASRPLQASNSDMLPSYPVKRSKKFADQQRGIDWLKTEAKTKFEHFYRTLLARWGVAPGYTGTCVLVPEAYRALEPLEIMGTIIQDQEKYAVPGTPRSFFSMYDHATTMVRALAWFSEWPRTGVQLDNFIGCGKFAPMDASHTCHHDHCIIHITYEAADVNVSREDCCREARALRQQNAADVPEHCSKHQPPCLMQHTALSTFEVYCIQFAVLRQARGMDAVPSVPRPRRWRYATYETQLPCIFPAVRVQPDLLVAEASSARKVGKPEITCKFCGRIRGWQSVIGFWTHLVKVHKEDVPEDARLAEVLRTADLWRTYWVRYSDGGKRDNPTMLKLRQMEDPAFGWQDVLDWNLRY